MDRYWQQMSKTLAHIAEAKTTIRSMIGNSVLPFVSLHMETVATIYSEFYANDDLIRLSNMIQGPNIPFLPIFSGARRDENAEQQDRVQLSKMKEAVCSPWFRLECLLASPEKEWLERKYSYNYSMLFEALTALKRIAPEIQINDIVSWMTLLDAIVMDETYQHIDLADSVQTTIEDRNKQVILQAIATLETFDDGLIDNRIGSWIKALKATLQPTVLVDNTAIMEASRAAALETKERETKMQATGQPYCHNTYDLLDPSRQLSLDEKGDEEEEGKVVSIIYDEKEPSRRNCYWTKQLEAYGQSQTPIFIWENEPVDNWTPPVELGEQLYKLPSGEFVLARSWEKLIRPTTSFVFRLQRLPENPRLGALDHTVGAAWNRTDLAVYKLSPVLQRKRSSGGSGSGSRSPGEGRQTRRRLLFG